jgi:prolyl oligopeptidase
MRTTAAHLLPTVAGLLILMLNGCTPHTPPYPPTEKKPVTDEYFGIKVADDYRWLDRLEDPAVRSWTDAQNAYTRRHLDAIPFIRDVQTRVASILENPMPRYYSFVFRRFLFALKFQPPKNQPFIVVFPKGPDTTGERIVVDPNVINAKGTTSIDWFRPSHDGALLAVCLSENGSEDGSIHVFDVVTGKEVGDVVPRAQFATGGGSVEWSADNKGFFYTRYPQGEERPAEDRNFYQQIYHHELGTPSTSDRYVIGKDFPRIAECVLSSSPGGAVHMVSVANGDGGEFAYYLFDQSGRSLQIARFEDKVVDAQFGRDGKLYFLSHATSLNGTILSMSLTKPDLSKAVEVLKAREFAIKTFMPARKAIYVVEMAGGPSRLRIVDMGGGPVGMMPMDSITSVGGLTSLGDDVLLFSAESYLNPGSWLVVEPSMSSPGATNLSTNPSVDFSDVEVVRETATSKDGTQIPLNILRRRGTVLDGNNPTILYGYGGFGIPMEPSYEPELKIWLEQGGVYVVANIRGGGEFGEAWHQAGMLTSKQNVFDDFLAAARYLTAAKYTRPERLAVMGGSNGGLLMGAALTQAPDAFAAVASYVGIYDMLRTETFPNGQFNVTEYGTVNDPQQFKALYAYSPYHHVVEGARYPAVLFVTGDNDGRVDPSNSRKMLARLQAATASGLPVLLRTDAQAGHGIGSGLSSVVAQESDVYAFLFEQLGVKYKPVTTK